MSRVLGRAVARVERQRRAEREVEAREGMAGEGKAGRDSWRRSG